jgi:hypothetical protein
LMDTLAPESPSHVIENWTSVSRWNLILFYLFLLFDNLYLIWDTKEIYLIHIFISYVITVKFECKNKIDC